ncbi:MAG: hypothetical protein Q9160_005892 [Pyrenula sp. 1 TL-2023]
MPRTFSFSSASTSSPTGTEPSPASESLVSRILFAPLLFISFIVSLLIVDREASSSVFGLSSPSDDNSRSSDKQGKEKKYYHSHQRKLAKREIGDAFKMRNKVIISEQREAYGINDEWRSDISVKTIVVCVKIIMFQKFVEAEWNLMQNMFASEIELPLLPRLR